METLSSISNVSKTHEDDKKEEAPIAKEDIQSILSTLPRGNGWYTSSDICLHQYKGFWYYASILEGVLSDPDLCRWNFSSSDILISSFPKFGTTWLKALAFAVVTRNHCERFEDSPLFDSNTHDLLPHIEFRYSHPPRAREPSLIPLFSTHMPFTFLPESILDCGCKIVYIYRDPKDAFVSLWHFRRKMKPNKESIDVVPLDQAFDLFCRGISSYGPCWDHVIGYWKAKLDRPYQVLFLKYKDMIRDPISQVISLVKFMGYPFSEKEEIESVPMRIVEMCSFESLRNLEVNNKNGIKTSNSVVGTVLTNKIFFRKGEVGDWRNYLTQEMADDINRITEEKFSPFGLGL